MLKFDLRHYIVLFFKQTKYQYETFKNNKAVEKAFAHEYPLTPYARTITLFRDRYWVQALCVAGLVIISFLVLSRPVSFSKQVPQKLKIEKQIQEKLAAIRPAPELLLEKMKEIEKVQQKPLISDITQNTFLNNSPQYTLLVNKYNKMMFVTEETESGYRVVEEFSVSLGLGNGDKEREGDNKTPEGAYSLIDLKTDDELPKMYGPYAAVLNYPSQKDLKLGKTGSGIWIHGTGTNQLTPDTQGCVELNDQNLRRLFPYLGKGTKIIIIPKDFDITPKENIVQKNLVRLAIES